MECFSAVSRAFCVLTSRVRIEVEKTLQMAVFPVYVSGGRSMTWSRWERMYCSSSKKWLYDHDLIFKSIQVLLLSY